MGSLLPVSKLGKTAWVSFFCAVVVTALYERNIVASLIWHSTHNDIITSMIHSESAPLYFDIGNYNFGAGDYDIVRAEYYFKKTIEIDDKFPGAHYQLARVYFINGRLNEALIEINKEIENYPENKRSHYVRGLIHGYGGALGLAERDFEEFLKWKTESWAGHNDLAWVYFKQGKFKESEKVSRAGLDKNPNNPWLLNSLGISLLNQGKKEEAKPLLLEAKIAFDNMAPENWGRAYPGNNPSLYNEGLLSVRKAIDQNLELVE